MWLRLLAVICFIAGVFTASIPSDTIDKCSLQCNTSQSPKFLWKTEKSYVFSYKSENKVIYAGKEIRTSSVVGKVMLQSIDRCNVILTMKDITVNEKMSEEDKEDFKTKLKIPLVAAFNNQELKTICPSFEESTQSLNIKKAIIASLTNTMTTIDVSQKVEEYDTMGKCHTNYIVEKGPELVIKKIKDLKTCTNRHTYITGFLDKKFPHTFLFETEHAECKQHVEGEIMKKIACKEVGKMKIPLKDKSNLIELSGTLDLDLIEINPRESLQYQITTREEVSLNLEDSRRGDCSEKRVEEILLKLCVKNMQVVDININSDFMELVSKAKVLSFEELNRIYESLRSGKLCSSKKVKDLFVDTLPVVGTDASVKLIAKLIENQEVAGLKANLLSASFALVPKPTKDTVAAVVNLVKNHPSPSLMLGVTTMIHRLCSSENCDRISSVNKIVTTFNEYLGPECSSVDEKKVITALKAFGNMGYFGKAYRNIIECVKNCSQPSRVKLAAIESFRRIDKKRPEEFLQAYADKNEDYEIRIAMFASIIKHADEQQLQQIAEVVENETDEQVSSYVYTYLKNMDKTTFPSKQKGRKLLQNLKIQEPNGNYRKYSKHIEVSGFNKLVGVGGAIETNIIQDPNTKIPRSVYTRLDADLFDRNFNLLEFGIRAENIEEWVSKLVGLKQELTKKKPRSHLESKNLLGDTNAELSLFVRAMNTEVFDLSLSDVIALREVVNIAEIMNKMAREKDFDLSHSFVFLNSKLVLPSITGRSFSIDLTGSSTVGLTAKSKVDLLSLPKAGDVQLQFQPSMNAEVSTSIGMQSNYPDVKIASRLHLESELKASFQVKEGRAVLAHLTLPSDDIMVVKMSTEILRIDDSNNAKPVFDKMQKKIDYCYKGLEKPAGISACAVLEVPKPLVIRTFPYFLPFRRVEFALKKTDSFQSYVFQLEVPKNSGEILKYKASLDTPGSRINRRFAADLEVIQRKDHKKFLVEVSSPFKSMGGSGSYTRSENLHRGTLELYTDSVKLFSSNFTSTLISSRGRKSYEASSSVSSMGKAPTKIDGYITITRGRKFNVRFDFKATKHASKPVRLRGSFTKEGAPTLSLKSEWKLSSDVSLISPFGDAHLSQTIDKASKQVQSISGNLSIDYQITGREKQAITFSGTSQTSSGKVNTNAKFQMTQNPDRNWQLNWDMQKQSNKSLKNDIMLKYGRHPESNYIHIKQNSTITKSGHGLCTAFLKIPSLNMSYNATVKYDLEFGTEPKIHVESDVYYRENKHVKGLVDVNYESKHPLKGNVKVEVECSRGHYIYEGNITQTSNNVTEGKSKFQYKKGKIVELSYKIETLSNGSVFHYDIESSFNTSSSVNPIRNKASLQLNSDYLILIGEISSKYSLQADFRKAGKALISLKSPKLGGKVEAVNEKYKKIIKLDLKLNPRRHIRASAIAEYGAKKRFHLEIVPSVESEPDKKILISSDIDIIKTNNSTNHNKSASHLITSNEGDTFSSKPQDVSYKGIQEFHLMSSIKNFPPISLSYRAELNEGLPKFNLNFSQNLLQKAKIEFGGNVFRNDKREEFSFKTLASSPDNSFENLALTLNHRLSHSESSTIMKSLLSFKRKTQLYKAEWNSDLHPHKLEMKAEILTPLKNFKKQAIGISFKQNNIGILSSINIETSDDKLVSLKTDLQKNSDGYNVACTFNSPFDIVRDVQAQITIEPQPNETQIEGYIDVNSARISEFRSSISISPEETNIDGSLRMIHLPNVDFEGLRVQYSRAKTIMSISGKIYFFDCRDITFDSEIKNENGMVSAIANIMTPYESLKNGNLQMSFKHQSPESIVVCHIDANGERIIDAEIKLISSSISTEIQSRLKTFYMPETLAIFKSERKGESFSVSIQVWNRTSSTIDGASNSEVLTIQNIPENILFDFKISKEVSEHNLKIYGLKAGGILLPVSVTFSINRKERSSHSLELRVCQETQQSICYNVIVCRKNVINSGNYHFYKKFTIEMKKFVDGYFEKSLGGLNLLLSTDKYDFKSKMVFHLNRKAVGYDITLRKRQNENDRHSFDIKLYHLLWNVRVASSIMYNPNRTLFEFKTTREEDPPKRLFLVSIGREINHKTNRVSCFIKMAHPNMSEPLLLSSEFQKVGASVRSKLMIRHNATRKSVLFADIIPYIEQKSDENDSKRLIRRSLLFKLYSEERTVDVSLMLTKQNSKLEDKFGYEWDLNLPDINNKGAIVATQKSKSIQIAYFVPSIDSEVLEKMTEDSGNAGLSLITHGRKIREIFIKTSGSCFAIDVSSSEPFVKSSFCIGKRSGHILQLVKGDVYHRRHKSLDVIIGLDLNNLTFVNVNLTWKKQYICQALKEFSGPGIMFKNCSVAEFEEMLKGNLEFYKKNVLKPTVKELWNDGKHYVQDKYKAFKTALTVPSVVLDRNTEAFNDVKNHTTLQFHPSIKDVLKEIWNQRKRDWKFTRENILMPLIQALKCSIQKDVQNFLKILPDLIGVAIDSIADQLKHCVNQFCVPDTYCHKFIELKNILSRKLLAHRKLFAARISEVQISNAVTQIKHDIWTFMKEIGSNTLLSRKIIPLIGRSVGKIVPHKTINATDKIIKKVYDRLSRDEDFNTAKDLIFELNKSWRDKLRQIQHIITENPLKLIQEQFQVVTYNPEEGILDLRIRQPLKITEIENLEKEIQKVIQELQESQDI